MEEVTTHTSYADNNQQVFSLKQEMSVLIVEYRKSMSDYVSTDDQVTSRIQYLKALIRNVIRPELEKNAYKKKTEQK